MTVSVVMPNQVPVIPNATISEIGEVCHAASQYNDTLVSSPSGSRILVVLTLGCVIAALFSSRYRKLCVVAAAVTLLWWWKSSRAQVFDGKTVFKFTTLFQSALEIKKYYILSELQQNTQDPKTITGVIDELHEKYSQVGLLKGPIKWKVNLNDLNQWRIYSRTVGRTAQKIINSNTPYAETIKRVFDQHQIRCEGNDMKRIVR